MRVTAWKINQITHGLHLRSRGLSYTAIAVVLNEYHGLPVVTADSVRWQLRSHGAAPAPRGPGVANLRRGSVAR